MRMAWLLPAAPTPAWKAHSPAAFHPAQNSIRAAPQALPTETPRSGVKSTANRFARLPPRLNFHRDETPATRSECLSLPACDVAGLWQPQIAKRDTPWIPRCRCSTGGPAPPPATVRRETTPPRWLDAIMQRTRVGWCPRLARQPGLSHQSPDEFPPY